MQVSSINDINQLQVSSSLKFPAQNIIPIPPFMMNRLSLVIQASLGNSKNVLFEAIIAIREFNKEMPKIIEAVEEARTSCQELLFWLYLANKHKVYSIPIIACCDVRTLTHFKALERAHLSQDIRPNQVPNQDQNQVPFLQDIKKPLKVIANSSSMIRDYLDKLTDM